MKEKVLTKASFLIVAMVSVLMFSCKKEEADPDQNHKSKYFVSNLTVQINAFDIDKKLVENASYKWTLNGKLMEGNTSILTNKDINIVAGKVKVVISAEGFLTQEISFDTPSLENGQMIYIPKEVILISAQSIITSTEPDFMEFSLYSREDTHSEYSNTMSREKIGVPIPIEVWRGCDMTNLVDIIKQVNEMQGPTDNEKEAMISFLKAKGTDLRKISMNIKTDIPAMTKADLDTIHLFLIGTMDLYFTIGESIYVVKGIKIDEIFSSITSTSYTPI